MRLSNAQFHHPLLFICFHLLIHYTYTRRHKIQRWRWQGRDKWYTCIPQPDISFPIPFRNHELNIRPNYSLCLRVPIRAVGLCQSFSQCQDVFVPPIQIVIVVVSLYSYAALPCKSPHYRWSCRYNLLPSFSLLRFNFNMFRAAFLYLTFCCHSKSIYGDTIYLDTSKTYLTNFKNKGT